MTKRLLFSYLTVTVVVLLILEIPLALFFGRLERERLTADVERDAYVIATIYEDSLERGLPPDPRPADSYAARTGARVVVDADGISVVDTEQPVNRDLSTRPEITAALAGERSSGTRDSETLGTGLLYVAVPVASGGVVHGALRITFSTDQVDDRIHRFWLGLVLIAVCVLGAMALIGWALARSVTKPLTTLNDTAARFAAGDLRAGERLDRGPPELRALDERMSHMAERLDALLTEQRTFVADASHQLRTPLTALRLRLENLQSRLGETDAAEVELALDEIDRLAALVADLLQLARAEEHAAPVATDLARLTADRVDTWTAAAELRDVRIHLAGAGAAVTVRSVPGAIEQILDNLLDNALTVSPRGSSIDVGIVVGSTSHRLVIADHGPGMSADDQTRATRRFWRGDTTTPGTGLGLAIVDALARASGGSLTLGDTHGGGLTVTVELPAG